MKSLSNRRILSSAALFLFATSAIMSAQVGQDGNHHDKSYEQLKAEHPGFIQIPGRLIRPDCVHQIPSGAKIEFGSDGNPTGDVKMNGQVIAHWNSCPEPSIDTRHLGSQHLQSPNPSGYGDGWVEASQWNPPLSAADNIDDVNGYWYVPGPPTEGGALLFMFNAIGSDTGGGWIMQPVLQWGNNGNWGGDYYSFASWLVGPESSGYAAYSEPAIIVNPGDFLFGEQYQNGEDGSTLDYYVNAEDTTTGQSSPYAFTSQSIHWDQAYAGVLEAYNVTSCSQFPTPLGGGPKETHFRQTFVAHGYPAYDFYSTEGFYGALYDYFGSGGPQCGFSVSVSGNGSSSGSTSLLTY
jgi:hypothetical protein